MNILVTGSAGFIGYSVCKKLLKSKIRTFGIDNFTNYYDVNLKKERIRTLKKLGLKNYKLDLSNKKQITNFFKKKKIDIIIHLAAQAGVRYSFIDPDSYMSSNVIGTYNILESIKKKNIKHLIFSSTSSVYGNRDYNSKFTENDKSDHQLSLYAATKKSSENICHSYSYAYQIPITVLRFFTVYGPWGRPDMALFKFLALGKKNKKIEVYNKGKMYRDFTYIDDLVESIIRLIDKIPKKNSPISKFDSISKDAPFRVVNIGNQKNILLNFVIKILEKISKIKFKKKFLKIQKGDVKFTQSSSKLLYHLTGYIPRTNIKTGIKKFTDWYNKFYG